MALGFVNIAVCEAQNDVGRMLRNHNVPFVAEQAGYRPSGRYRIVDLTTEGVPYSFEYRCGDHLRKWKDQVGRTWMEADFRITFAKLKTHEHDWLTLSTKNVYGTFPPPDKVARYHLRSEVFDATARLIRCFPIHFAFLDGWVASDGFQGYKIAHPRPLKVIFAGRDCVAVDMEAFRRAELDPKRSKMLKAIVAQCRDGVYPTYQVAGDPSLKFRDVCPEWENISNTTVEGIDVLEEVYVTWGILNLKPIAMAVDYAMFPPKTWFYRLLIQISQKLYGAVVAVSKAWRWLTGQRADGRDRRTRAL